MLAFAAGKPPAQMSDSNPAASGASAQQPATSIPPSTAFLLPADRVIFMADLRRFSCGRLPCSAARCQILRPFAEPAREPQQPQESDERQGDADDPALARPSFPAQNFLH